MPPVSSPPPALAHVEVLDVRQSERAVVLACDWVGNIYKFVELVFHAKSDFLDAGGFYLHLNTSLAHVSHHERACVRISPLSDC